jgi:UDPglucose--hexose-1-phosphate uridylyltransferase
VLAPGRAERPEAFSPQVAEPRADAADTCPFCEGREGRTPPEVWADRPGGGEPDSSGWRVRSVPNLFPVLGDAPSLEGASPGEAAEGAGAPADAGGFSSAADPMSDSRRTAEVGLFGSVSGEGSHEVIVSTPRHETSLAGLSTEEFATAVEGWRERMRAVAGESAYAHLIVNEGPAAGASLEHSHAQLYGMQFVPAEIARERERSVAYHQRTMGSHLLGDVAIQEVRKRERTVAIDEEAILLCPWASRSPFELRVVPRSPAPSFEAAGQGGAAMIETALRALAGVFGRLPQFNLWVRTAPSGAEEFCWHVDIVPRLTIRAGFELGTGVDICTYAPERAAQDLREALSDRASG